MIMATQPLRQRKRLEAMRRAQASGISLFEERGFRAVSMAEVALVSDVSVASLFRYFRTKEQLVLWDEHDERIINAVAAQLEQGLSAVDAVSSGVAAALNGAFGAGASLERRKMALVFREPDLLAAFRTNTRAWAAAFAPIFSKAEGADQTSLSHRGAALAAAAVMELCLEEWFRREGKSELDVLMAEGFSALRPEKVGSSRLPRLTKDESIAQH